jgi:chromosome segregation ATPase
VADSGSATREPDRMLDTVGEANLTSQEQEEIRAHINEVARESRIAVAEEAFVPSEARRGLGLPLGVAAGAVILAAAGVLVLTLVFRRTEAVSRAEAGQYVSVEGRLIRALREESQEQLGAKNQEIDAIRGRLVELEEQQRSLESDIARRLAQREEEIRRQLQSEIDAERARLVAAGTGNEQLAGLMARFEAERRSFYERQMQEYRRQLEAERAGLQADIQRLRTQYQQQLAALQNDRERLVEEFSRKEAQLRSQLQQRTQVLAASPAPAQQQAEAAGRALAELNQRAEAERAVEAQVVGQIERIRQALARGDAAAALPLVRSLQGYLGGQSPLSTAALASRRDTDLFLLGQLEQSLQRRADEEQGGAQPGSLARDLETVRRLRRVASTAAGPLTDDERGQLVGQIVASLADLGVAQKTLEQLLFAGERKQFETRLADQQTARAALETTLRQRDEALARSQAALAALSEQSAAARRESDGRIAQLEEQERLARRDATRAQLEDSLRESNTARQRAEASERELQQRVGQLAAYEEQVRVVQQRYKQYVAAVEAARARDPAAASTAARQELNEFLQSAEVRRLFTDLAPRVDALFAATQTAGSSAALSDAADIARDIASQPTRQAALAKLRFEKTQAANAKDEQLLAILSAMESALTAAQ